MNTHPIPPINPQGRLTYEFDLSTLAHISDGYSAGQLDMAVHSLLTKRRIERLRAAPVDIPEILQWLCKVWRRGWGVEGRVCMAGCKAAGCGEGPEHTLHLLQPQNSPRPRSPHHFPHPVTNTALTAPPPTPPSPPPPISPRTPRWSR